MRSGRRSAEPAISATPPTFHTEYADVGPFAHYVPNMPPFAFSLRCLGKFDFSGAERLDLLRIDFIRNADDGFDMT
jgi:hypothetical protein